MKKLLSLIVVAVLVLSILPMGAMAEAAQKAFSEGRTQTIEKPTGGIKAPEENKTPEKPSYREESTLYSFGFETDPAEEGWTFFDLDGNGTNWAQSTTKKHSGDYSLMSSSYKPTSHNVDNWALTPAIELPATGMAALKFWIAQQSSSYPETWALYIGEVADPDQMAVLQADTTEGGSTFIQKEYDISEYLGKTVYIAFVNHNCNDKYYIYIDDVEIVADPEGVPVTPTPAPTEVPAGYLDDALNAEDTELELTFVSGGTYPWIVMTDEADRVYAMSGNKGVHNSTSTVTATFTLDSPHQLSFDYMAWGEGASYDKCIFSLDGTVIFTKGAENQPWQNYVVETPLEAGEHTIGFAFTKDGSDNGTGDYFKVDNVKLADASSITPTPAPTEVPANYLDDAMNAADTELTIHFESTGTYPWIVLTEGDRVYAQSGNKGVHSTSSTVTATFTLEGYYLLSFDYMAWGEGSSTLWDKCIFKLDGAVIFTKGAEDQPWQNYAVEEPLEPGEHTIEFTFTKDGSANGTGDYFNIDNVKLEQTAAPAPTPEPTAAPEYFVGYYFETDADVEEWCLIDADGDGFNWTRRDSEEYAYEGVGCLTSASYDNNSGAVLYPDNWAISPSQKVVDAEAYFSFYIAAQDPSYPAEHIGIYIGSGNEVENYELIDEFTLTSGIYEQHSYSLEEYVGEEVSLAIRHFNCYDMFMVNVDMFVFVGTEEGEPVPEPDPTPTPVPTETPEPTPVPEDLIVGYYFESEEELEGWNFIGTEDTNWVHSSVNPGNYDYAQYAHEGSGFILSYSFVDYVGSYQADNWAITPPFKVPENSARVSFYANNANATYPEAFDLYIGTSDDVGSMTLIEADISPSTGSNDAWTLYEFDLSEYAGETIYIAFHDHCYDMYELWIDQVQFWGEYGAEIIEEVNIEGFIEPAWGEAPFYGVTVPEGANYTIELVEWYDNNALGAMAPTAVFDNEDTTYSIYVQIVPNEGYEFSESLVMLINGETTFVDAEYSSAEFEGAYIWSIEFTVERELIDAIEITELDIPEWGANPDFDVVVPEGALYGIKMLFWCTFDEETDDTVELGAGYEFNDPNEEYYVFIVVEPAEGYKFDEENVTALLNGGEMEILEYAVQDGMLMILAGPFTVEAPIVWGDANGDGETTIEDALLIMRYLIGIDEIAEENLEWCDVNGDGSIDLTDALLIMRKVIGTIEAFPVEE
ncbi:MAG: choice-of-anchor J domain-containing protein [Clostridia bacterium]|nr:choice-of-anchor J domain-containing protein [Clostridia bacterium]